MKKLKLFPKTFLYTFLVMLFVTVAAHGLLYLLAPHMIVSTNSVLENGAVIESSINTEVLIKSAILKALPVSLVCSTIIALGCSLLYSKVLTSPIRLISKTTEQMENLDKTAACPVTSTDEIGGLAANINKLYSSLLSTIENLEEEKQKVCEAEQSKIDFLRAASHELKTPVTALNAILENMILGVGKYKDRDTCLIECKAITEQLSSMIKEVLDTSKMDFTREKQEKFDLSECIPVICEPYQLIAKAKELDFHLEIRESCPVYLSKKIWKRFFPIYYPMQFLIQSRENGYLLFFVLTGYGSKMNVFRFRRKNRNIYLNRFTAQILPETGRMEEMD